MKISIVTPIYKGNKYLNKYLKMIQRAILNCTDVEVIWINDSPEIQLEYDEELSKEINLKIIQNDNNCGIHKSRINGMKVAIGEYILFLDQDDEITEDALISQYNAIQGYDMVIGNGYFEDKNGQYHIFGNEYSQKFATKKKPYILIRDFIVSPGQCLIKKTSIPKEWTQNFLKNNGTDDYLLWLLMFNNDSKITYNYKVVYKHVYTGENVSLQEDKMYKSQLELLEILYNNEKYDRKDYKKLRRAIIYKHEYKNNFLFETLKNLDIFLYNVMYKIKWKGYRMSK